MSIANCRTCGRLFQKSTSENCPDCIRHDEETFDQLKHYLRDHEGCSIPEVAEALSIPEDKIIQFLRSGRLIAAAMQYPCESCGKMIQSARYCDVCRSELESSMKKVAADLRRDSDMKKSAFGDYVRRRT